MRRLAKKSRFNSLFRRFNFWLFSNNRSSMFSFLPWNRKSIIFNREVIQIVLELSDKQVFFDSSKLIDDLPFFYFDKMFDLSIIYLYKRPESQINSELKRHSEIGLRDAAKKFMEENSEIVRMITVNRLKTLVLDYEKFCMDGDVALSEFFAFIGVRPLTLSELQMKRSKDLHIMGNIGLRKEGLKEIRSDESWKRELSESQKQEISEITKDFYPMINKLRVKS